jgi:hypothetical protein
MIPVFWTLESGGGGEGGGGGILTQPLPFWAVSSF